MKLSRKTKWCSAALGGLFLMFAAFAFWPCRFYYDSVCSQCGAIRYTTKWQLPQSGHSLFTHSTAETTPLSRYLTSSGLVTAHPHHWLFGHGGGNGVRCALGEGDSIRASVMSLEIARLLEFARQYGEQYESGKFLRLTFDRDISRTVLSLAGSVPTNGFSSREQYRSWISDEGWVIDQALEFAQKSR